MNTESRGQRLATLRNHEDRSRTTIRSAPITERLAQIRRKDAFLALFADAHRKPTAVYELQRAEPRSTLPDERQFQLIHEGIKAGYITRDQIIRYRTSQLLEDLEAFREGVEPVEATFLPFVTEAAEAIEAHTIARGMPTPSNCDRAIKEANDMVAITLIRNTAIQLTGRAS